MFAYAKKALTAAALSCVAVILGWNLPGWIDGSEQFLWRSVLAGLVASFINGLAVFYATNKPDPAAVIADEGDAASAVPEG